MGSKQLTLPFKLQRSKMVQTNQTNRDSQQLGGSIQQPKKITQIDHSIL